jgi:hypothetical protein
MSGAVHRERQKVTTDAAAYERLYDIPADIVQQAMTQNFSKRALEQENLERLLRSVGFDSVEITFRRFLGEDQCRQQGGEHAVNLIHNYLVDMLPMSRNLFKYFVLVAR